jgi:hypothetical protein
MITITKSGRTTYPRNIGAVIRFIGKQAVRRVAVYESHPSGARLWIETVTGDSAQAGFASFTACQAWVRERRALRGVPVTVVPFNLPPSAIRHHVTGAIERGESVPVVEQPAAHCFTVTIKGCTREQAEQVIRERLGHDEDYGFNYTLNF